MHRTGVFHPESMIVEQLDGGQCYGNLTTKYNNNFKKPSKFLIKHFRCELHDATYSMTLL